MDNKQKSISALLWLWIMVATLSYLYQFENMVGPILQVLGLK